MTLMLDDTQYLRQDLFPYLLLSPLLSFSQSHCKCILYLQVFGPYLKCLLGAGLTDACIMEYAVYPRLVYNTPLD